ncbi:hypothetical protein SEA_TEATEALATTE_81 [Gordonia phage Teatealatte]|uniref:Uncharacterized protein n=2 Tax=Demosthenesvirus katyusha TaxID=1982108 RepID=A0A345MCB7_9CAUD|nr:hypothetical protein SEA_TEATEALATTE_81 [Gordonia phage Teatealatte]QBP29636.1 hypothetical protein SEA_TREDGE_80 [Gordonia phage Tredge]
MAEAEVTALKICWPGPDGVCLQGGCGYCHTSQFVSIPEIEAYAKAEGFWYDYCYSRERGFPNFRVRIKED